MRKILLFVGVLLFLTQAIWADGIIIPHPSPKLPKPERLAIKYHRVDIDVKNQAAIVKIDQVFKNNNRYQLEGTYIFPLPKGAAISKFAMDVDGKMIAGKILDKDQARRLYESMVRKLRDPALLEYIGQNIFQARIFPIPANGEKRIKLEYTELLKMDNGLVKLVYPLATEKFSSKPLEEVAITLKIKSNVPIKNVYSPSHNLYIERINDYTVKASYEKNNTLPDKDLVIYYSVSKKDFGLSLDTYKEDKNALGYFLLLISPKEKVAKEKVLPKEIVFVIDTSGSMADTGKIDYAKKTLKFCLTKLNSRDYFNVVSFCDSINYLSKHNLLATTTNKKKSLKFADKLDATGGTNIYEAITTSLRLFSKEDRPRYLIFLTDGLPTVGKTRISEILDGAKKYNKGARIYTFGVGYDVNTILLDQLANQNKGLSEYVAPGEEIETAISSFYNKISQPILADIKLKFSKVRVSLMYPKELPDIFKGSQLVVLGRYRGQGDSLIELLGKQAGKLKKFTYEAKFARINKANRFIARLWAVRRIGYLLEVIRIKGENKELIDEIVRLSKEYGIITPYTSFLVQEDHPIQAEAPRESFQILAGSAPTGKQAVKQSQNIQSLKKGQYETKTTYQAKIKKIEDKTFYYKKGVWVDSDYKGQKTVKIRFLSEKYLQLIKKEVKLAKYLSVGERVIICYKGKVYEVK